jgi:hypothetical protein
MPTENIITQNGHKIGSFPSSAYTHFVTNLNLSRRIFREKKDTGRGHKIGSFPSSAYTHFVTNLNLSRRIFREKIRYHVQVSANTLFLIFLLEKRQNRALNGYSCSHSPAFLLSQNSLRSSIEEWFGEVVNLED